MRKTTTPMFRYGDADFDRDYLKWGLHDKTTQVAESDSILRILCPTDSLRILDLACGVGTHAVEFAKRGHRVTAVDLSSTFVDLGRAAAREAGVEVIFEVGDIKRLPYAGSFDAVTWIERSFFDEEIVQAARRYLTTDGRFIFDVRNREHPKTKRLASNWRTWREEGGVFHLESHETDPQTGVRRNAWVEIDANNDTWSERVENVPSGPDDKSAALTAWGFSEAEYRTFEGSRFDGGEEPYWLWVVGRK